MALLALYNGCENKFDYETAYAHVIKKLCRLYLADPNHDGFFNDLAAIDGAMVRIVLVDRKPHRVKAFCSATRRGRRFQIEFVQAFEPRRGYGESILIVAHQILRSMDRSAAIEIKGPFFTPRFWDEMRRRHDWKYTE